MATQDIPTANGSGRPFDIVVWGATGFTGRLVAEYLAKHAGDARWAMAGRSKDKLEAVRRELAGRVPSAADTPILLGNAGDPASLDAITAQTRVLCATVGPFAKHGEPVVAACVRNRADYCDITGEVQFIRAIIDAHHEAARAAGVRIVPTCGFDSIPSDLGAFLVAEHARSEEHRALAEVRGYVTASKGGASGGTIASMLNMLEEMERDRSLRRLFGDPYALSPDRAHDLDTDGRDLVRPRWDADAGGWAAPWVMAAINTRVVRRSNALLGHRYGGHFRYQEAMLMRGRALGAAKAAALAGGMGAALGLLSLPAARGLISKRLPAPGEGPSQAERDAGFFKMRFYGVLEGDAAPTLLGRVEGTSDPGYGETCKMLGESALCLARDPHQPGFDGGVLTPATAMGMRLVERLRNAGMTLDVRSISAPSSEL